jgi:NADPH2:quinone reductase
MRAVVLDQYGSLDNAALREVPDPVPGPGQVLVEVHATCTNYVDLVLMSGKYQFKPDLPFVPGKGPAGIVRAVGEKVTAFRPGDRVLAMAELGGYAELALIHVNNCYRIPDRMSFVDAASMALVYDTAWFALRERGRFQPGDRVLVLGASGGVGLAAVQLVKALGGTALAGISNLHKADLVQQAGADAIVDLGRSNLRESLREQVMAATEGHGADVIIDPLGDEIFEAAIRAAAWCGRVVVIGFAAGGIPSLRTNYLLVKNIDVGGLQISDYRRRRPDLTAKCFAENFSLYEAGKIGPLPTTVRPIEEFAAALRSIEDRSARGRIVLTQRRD